MARMYNGNPLAKYGRPNPTNAANPLRKYKRPVPAMAPNPLRKYGNSTQGSTRASAPVVNPRVVSSDAPPPPRKYRSYSKPPSVGSRKKAKSRPPSVKQQVRSAKEDKKRYLALQKNRANQSERNYGKKAAGQKYKKGQEIYNSQTKEIKKSRYSWSSHKAAMKRRGKKATQESYAKFKRYNGI